MIERIWNKLTQLEKLKRLKNANAWGYQFANSTVRWRGLTEYVQNLLLSQEKKDQKLTQRKMCNNCGTEVKTWWELECCNMNPEGLVKEPMPHGNEIEGTTTCEDEYCDPRYPEIDDSEITEKYVKEHSVHERCCECQQFMEAM